MNCRQNAAIGVFDSGVGGLTVVREIMKQLPEENIVYFGDTARVPYGNKSRDTITRYSEQIIRFLMTREVKAIVIACNTASAYALDTVSEEFDLPILGVVRPGARTAVKTCSGGGIGVIGTEGTISSGVYAREIHRIDPTVSVTGQACPLFVPLVEEGWTRGIVMEEVASHYLRGLKESGIDTLILGCTHYPLLYEVVRNFMGEQVRLVDPAYETARELRELLTAGNMLRKGREVCHSFYVSDTARKFATFADSILPCKIEMAQKINIEEYAV